MVEHSAWYSVPIEICWFKALMWRVKIVIGPNDNLIDVKFQLWPSITINLEILPGYVDFFMC